MTIEITNIATGEKETFTNAQMLVQMLKQEIYCESGRLNHLIADKKMEQYIKELECEADAK